MRQSLLVDTPKTRNNVLKVSLGGAKVMPTTDCGGIFTKKDGLEKFFETY